MFRKSLLQVTTLFAKTVKISYLRNVCGVHKVAGELMKVRMKCLTWLVRENG